MRHLECRISANQRRPFLKSGTMNRTHPRKKVMLAAKDKGSQFSRLCVMNKKLQARKAIHPAI